MIWLKDKDVDMFSVGDVSNPGVSIKEDGLDVINSNLRLRV